MSATILAMPELGFEQVSFDLVVPVAVSRMEGRRTEELRRGSPFWRAEYATGRLDPRQAGRADAFFRQCKSRGAVFRAHDIFRPRPIEWAAANPGQPFAIGGFNGTAAVAALPNAHTVQVAGVPANFQFREGDYVEIVMSAYRIALHSIAADAKASGSGAVTLSIDPGLDGQNFTTAATVNFERPSCLMRPFGWESIKSPRRARGSFFGEEVFLVA